MNQREREIRSARRILSDVQLTSFLRFIRDERDLIAADLINADLDRGRSLDSIFYTGNSDGYLLHVEPASDSTYTIHFGCRPRPLAGDGGEWTVRFDANGQVEDAEGGATWIS